MFEFPRLFRAFGAMLFTVAVLCACGGSHGSGPAVLPSVPNGEKSGGRAAASTGNVFAINAGGAAAGGFAADTDFNAAGTTTYAVTNAIDTSGVTNPPPQSVFQDERYGANVTYTIPGLTAGAAYTVRLDFAELYWTAAGQRVFSVTINNTKVLSNFDIYATTGARFKAIAKTFDVTASSAGTIAIVMAATKDNAAIDALEISSAGGTMPTPTPTPTAAPTSTPAPGGSLAINSGGTAVGSFVADANFAADGTTIYKVTNPINTSAVSNPPPQSVFQDERYGSTVAYTIPGLRASSAYSVRLDFAELYWSSAGRRAFNVAINNVTVLSNFDIFAATGAQYKAIAKTFNVTSSANGTIAIALTAITDNAAIDAIEISPAGGTSPTPTPTQTPTAPPSAGFNDYTTFGYDNQRDVYNPNTTSITPAVIDNGSVHLAWQATIGGGDYNTMTQPMLATQISGHSGVLFVGGGSGNVYGYDALTGTMIWKRQTGQETYTCENNYVAYFGVGGTVAYDPASRSLYVVGNKNASPNTPGTNSLLHLDGASGALLGEVNFAPATSGWPGLDFSHTSVTLGSNGLAYVGTGATCDISSWRGRVAAIRVPAMTLASTLFTVWNGTSQPWGGGGVWGWGGVSLDFNGNVITGVGNTDDGSTTHGSIVAPFEPAPKEYSSLGDSIFQASPDLGTIYASHHPIPTGAYSGNSVDLDLNGTPVIFRPNGTACNPIAALQAKSGALYLYDATRIAGGPLAQYQLAPSTYADGFLGGPAFSHATGMLYAAVPSSSGSLYPPGMIAIDPGCGSPSVAWHSSFGPDSYPNGTPRSVPAVSAGGVVLVGTPCSPDGSGGCSRSAVSAVSRLPQGVLRKPSICCAPPGSDGGALWALNAATGTVLNGGKPLITTSAPLRVPATIDGNWIFVLDNNGSMYGLTIDSRYAAVAARSRAVDARMLRRWQAPPSLR